MLGRSLCLLALGVVLVAGCGDGDGDGTTLENSSGITRQIAGGWVGHLHQKGLKPFKVAADINPSGAGRVAYTGIKCGGDWTLSSVLNTRPPHYIFTEVIETGRGGSCKGRGKVDLLPIQRQEPNGPAYTRMNYTFTGGGVTSSGLLRRVHPPDVIAIFHQTRVPRH